MFGALKVKRLWLELFSLSLIALAAALAVTLLIGARSGQASAEPVPFQASFAVNGSSEELDRYNQTIIENQRLNTNAATETSNEELLAALSERKASLLKAIESNPGSIRTKALPQDVLETLPPEAKSLVEEEVESRGKLTVVAADNDTAQNETYLYTLAGISDQGSLAGTSSNFHLYFIEPPANLISAPDVIVKGIALDSKVVLDSATPGSLDIKASYVPALVSGNRTVLVIRTNYLNDSSMTISKADVEAAMFNNTASVSKFYQESSYGKVSFSGVVTDLLTANFDSSKCTLFCFPDDIATAADAAATRAGYNLGNYAHIVYLLPPTPGLSGGLGEIPGKRVWINDFNRSDMYAHELGHNLGLDHANDLDCGAKQIDNYANCSSHEYGDWFDVMGISHWEGQWLDHFNASHKAALGWLTPSQVQTVSASPAGTYTVFPLEKNDTTVKAIRVPKPDTSEFYYFEYRQALGLDGDLLSGVTRGAICHIGNGTGAKTNLVDITPANDIKDVALSDGKSFYDYANNIYVTQISHDSNSVTLSVKNQAPDETAPNISINIPATGSIISGLVYFQADASDNVGVTKVDLSVDNKLASSPTTAPYAYVWDATGSYVGIHTLTAVAYDAAGNSKSTSITVKVNNFTPTHNYLFTWYDQSTADWRDWVLMANPATGTASARTEVKIGNYTMAGDNIAVGAPASTPQFPGVIGGPVTVASSQPLITSQRVLYKNSFNEIAGMPSTDLDTTYYFTWYDSNPTGGMKGDWILIGNQGTSDANVEVFIGGQLKGTYTVPVGDKVTPSYPNLTDGPVKVVSTNGQPLIVSQRVLFKDSFNEVLGMPASRLSTEYNFTWYDDKTSNFMRGNWILIGNQDTGDAEVDVFIGGTKMGSYTVPEGGRVTPQYPDVMSGPVKVVSTNGKKFIVSQRILFKDSFEEFQGLTASEFGTNLWFTWYDSKPTNGMMGNWILVANTSNQTANVDIYVGATKMGSYQVPAGGEITPTYPNTMAGPVRVVSTNSVPVLATQRVIYLDSFNEIGGMQLR